MSQTLESGRSPVQGGGLIPALVRDLRRQSASEIDDAGAELGSGIVATTGQQVSGASAAADIGTNGAESLEPQSTSRSRGPELFLARPSTRDAELSASSHHDCLVAQSTASWVTSHEPSPDEAKQLEQKCSPVEQ